MKYDKNLSFEENHNRYWNEILSSIPNNKERLLQCAKCANDPEKCGCTEKDEDVNGMCMKYKERMIKNERIPTTKRYGRF